MEKRAVRVIGAGLAGCEAAYQLLSRGYKVQLFEMRPRVRSAAHKTDGFAELVCSNSLKSSEEGTSSGLIKAEAEVLGSLIISVAKQTKVEAGGALAVDREAFSAKIEAELRRFSGLTVVREEYLLVDDDLPTIYATGPLTSEGLSDLLKQKFGEGLHFFDAVAPIVDANSIDMNHAFFGGRYNKGGDDYLNLPLTKEEYTAFYKALITAEVVKLKDFEYSAVFEGCMAIEIMVRRGEDTIRFGPLKPVGLYDADGKRPYAVVQLRKETNEGTAYNMVGFQTNLTFGEQKRVFGMIPALKDAEFLRFGVMHRNTYIKSPKYLDATFKLKDSRYTYFAGQMTGVEGYVESALSGLLAAIHLDRQLRGLPVLTPPSTTISGALSNYISSGDGEGFQPMNANFGILPMVDVKDKKLRKKEYYNIALSAIIEYNNNLHKED